MVHDDKMHVAIVGSGAAGLAAAWLLSQKHRVTLLEKDDRLGGHAHTATIDTSLSNGHATTAGQCIKVDTGFIVYNEPSYPNLTKWFQAMRVATENSDMSFAVSRENGEFEYAGGPALGLLAQPSLVLKPRLWRMLLDLLRFYKEAPTTIPQDSEQSLGDYLTEHRYSQVFIDDHLLPFGAAIWSTPQQKMLDYPAAAFIRFCDNHGLLQVSNRPQWRTVSQGSERYVSAVEKAIGSESIVCGFDVARIQRHAGGVSVFDRNGQCLNADQVVVATHADQALSCIESPTEKEAELLSMNRLQNIAGDTHYIVTLNPVQRPAAEYVIREQEYQHPVFTQSTWHAQQSLWSLQGENNTWFCGSYFGSGFHEDAVQSGLAVAEQLGGHARPWQLENPSSRIVVPSRQLAGFRPFAETAA